MQFAYMIQYVKDVAQTIDFYENAFGLKRKMIHESGDYGEMDTGTTTLAFAAKALMQQIGKNPSLPVSGNPSHETAFTTDDVPAALEVAISAGAQKVQDPTEMPWGQTIAYVNDINGFLVEICTPIEHDQ